MATKAVPIAAGLITGAKLYKGITVRETAGSTARVQIYDNASAASGTLIATVALAANASWAEWANDDQLYADAGLYVAVTGTVEGSIRIG